MRLAKRVYRLGLIGYPLGHSLSPQLHRAALASARLEGDYRLFPIPPGEGGLAAMSALVGLLHQGELHGLNVTIPHKQYVMSLVDELSEVARAVGAVNTIYKSRDDILVGDNTDVPGFLRDLSRLMGASVPGRGLVLGAGGSARAVVYGLAANGWNVKVLARRVEQATALITEIGAVLPGRSHLEVMQLVEENLALLGDVDLVVNTTPVGMFPHVAGCPWPDTIPLPGHATIYDLVYNPIETVLVRRAKEAGQPAAGGAGMLVAQAALAFQRWTGIDAPFDVMERAFFAPQNITMGE